MILLAEHDEPSLAAKKKRRHVALEKATPTPKNRVWNFFDSALGRPDNEPPLSWETATGSVQFSYETASGRAYYYTRDHLGSVREMLNSSGSIVSRYSYDPFGRVTLVSGSNLATKQYAGMYLHQTSGLYLTKFRAFDANTGRWLSRDPIGENGGYNLYEYCIDDPERFIDPSGRMGALAAGGLIDLSLGGPENPIADVVAGGAIIIILGIDAATVDAVIHNQAQASSRPIDHVAPDISKIPIPNSLAECKKDGGQCEWRYAWCVHNRLDPTSNRSMWENYDCETQYQLCKAGHGWGGPWPRGQTWKTSKNVWPDKW